MNSLNNIETPVERQPMGRRIVAALVAVSLFMQPLYASAQVIAGGPTAGRQPAITSAPNGVPVVNITAPNGAGVSHNQYQQYNVDTRGVILNNSAAVVQTQQAGWIVGNPNLVGANVRIILNEVTGNLPSSLNGYTEVAGSRAEVVIANPNGITCNGCGFINTSRGILTTGSPVFGGSGSLDGFRVVGGQITIGPNGLNGSNLDQLDLIARSLSVNGQIQANTLNVVTGANQVAYGDLSATPIAGNGPAPINAIDVALLGGMYANKIRLLSTEAGVGVNSQGVLAAQAGDFNLDAQGRITLAGNTQATGRLNISSTQDIANSGVVYSAQQGTLTSGGQVTNSGLIAAQGDLTVNANSLQSPGTVASGMDSQGNIGASGNLNIATSATLQSTGQNLAGGSATLSGGNVVLRGATTQVNGDIQVTSGTDVDHSAGVLQSAGTLHLSAGGTVDNRQGSLAAASVVLQSAALDNRGGQVVHSGNGDLQVGVSGRLDNQGGVLVGNGGARISAGDFDNKSGVLQTASGANLSATGMVDNSAGGQIVVSGAVQIAAGQINNSQGQLTATGRLDLTVNQDIDNTSGLIAANGDVTVNARNIGNRQGVLGSAQGALSVGATGSVDNLAGRIEAAQNLAVTAQGLDNTGGTVAAGNVLNVDAGNQSLNNSQGTLVAQQAMRVRSGALNNDAGVIQAGGALSIDTQGQTLTNTNTALSGGVIGHGTVALSVGNLDNRAGYVAAKGALSLSASAGIVNGGALVSEDSLTLTAASLDNRGGQVQSLGDVSVSASSVNNSGSLIRSGAQLSIAATDIDNTATAGNGQGLEGQSVSLDATRINNTQGAIRSNATLNVTSNGRLDNMQGLISGANVAIVDRDPANKTLVVVNTGGTAIAGQSLNIDSASLSGNGQVLSQGDLNVKLSNDYDHSGVLLAMGNASLETAGTLTNRNKLQAGNTLTLKAATINNESAGEITGTTLRLNATSPNTFNNRGLIDSANTLIETITLNNLGLGRIYGDQVSIGATTVNNLPENGVAPVIAARNRLDIGATTINNREHGLIFSAGDLSIGGGLDASKRATGQATTLNNASATIEAAGNLDLAAAQVNNTNEHFSTQDVQISTENRDECQGLGSPNRYLRSQVWYRTIRDSFYRLETPEGGFDKSYEYIYTRTVSETQVASNDPAKLLAGGNLRFSAGSVFNDKSQIVAGGTLGGTIASLTNTEVAGARTTVDSGTTKFYIDHQPGGSHNDWTEIQYYTYAPAPSVQAISINPTVYQQNGSVAGSGQQIGPLASAVLNQTAGGAGGASVSVAGNLVVTQVASAQRGGAVIRTTAPNVSLPNSSLFRVHAQAGVGPYVETDARFISYKTFISSDYMLARLSLDPARVAKRLGDGFYEQKLVADQVLQLTGRRFLGNAGDNEAQYRALLDNGVAVAQNFNLKPGIALSAEQMAQLTSDIVWLVEKEVKLADGQTVKALVPQVYLRAGQADVTGNGALIAGANVNLDLTTLSNSGTLAARNALSVNAENLHNLGGRISGQDVLLQARTDLNNLGGIIDGQRSLVAVAGRDLNIASQTQTSRSAQGERTNLSREGGVFVSDPGATLNLVAGRDLNLNAARVANSGAGGSTTLAAGHNLNLGTVSESNRHDLVLSDKIYRKESVSQEVGSTVQTAGDLRLQAGQDATLRAASVSSSAGALTVVAGNDVNITAGQTHLERDEASYSKSKGGWGSKKTVTVTAKSSETTAQGGTLSGDTLTVVAGNNVTTEAAMLVATGDLAIAGKNISIGAAEENRMSQREETQKTSGLYSTTSNGRPGVAIGSKTLGTESEQRSVSHVGSTVGSLSGNVTIAADQDLVIAGSRLQAAGNIDASGRNVTITSLVDTVDAAEKRVQETSGLRIGARSNLADAVAKIQQSKDRAEETDDPRLKALYAARAAYVAKDIAQMVAASQQSSGSGGINGRVSIGVGVSRQESTSKTHAESLVQAQAAAGGDIAIRAVGEAGNGVSGDLKLKGAEVQGRNVLLSAARDLEIQSQALKQSTASKTTSVNAEVGVYAGGRVGGGGAKGGFGLYAEGSAAESKTSLETTTHEESRITATETLTLVSGRDTSLQGAVAKATTLRADVGRNLSLISEQDEQKYKNGSLSVAAEGRIAYGNDSGAQGSLSLSQTDAKYKSVQEQTGFFAGQGGFDLQVGNRTQLTGAVIASEAGADKNRLSTQSFGAQDLQNRYDLKSFSFSITAGTDGNSGNSTPGSTPAPSTLPAFGQGVTPGLGVPTLEHQEGTTKSAIAAGTIEIRGQDANSLQQVASLSRDTQGANAGAIKNPLDLKKLAEKQEMGLLMGELGNRALGDYALSQKQDAQREAADAKQAVKNASSDEERQAAQQRLDDANARVAQWSDGGLYKIALHGIVGGLQAKLAGGNVLAGITGSVANEALTPWVADQIAALQKEKRDALVAERARIDSLPAGADRDAAKDKLDQQTQALETERRSLQQVVSLAVGGVVGLATGGNAGTALSGAAVALDATKNNYLKHSEITALAKAWAACGNDAHCKNDLTREYRAISDTHDAELKACQSFSCLAGHLAAINEAQDALALIKKVDDSGYLSANVTRWQNKSVELASLTAAQKRLVTNQAEALALNVTRLCRGLSAEACSGKILLDKQNAAVRNELIYMLAVFSPAGRLDDAKTLLTGSDVRGEESSRLLALLGIATVGVGKGLGKAADLVELLRPLAKNAEEFAQLANDVAKVRETLGLTRVAQSGLADLAGAATAASSRSGNLCKGEVCKYGFELVTHPQDQALVSKIAAGSDKGGKLTEELVENIAKREGFESLAAKYGSNNGFDHVLIKRNADGSVMILDSKQMDNFSTKLSVGAGGNVQLSKEWIDAVIGNLQRAGSGGDAIRAIQEARDSGKLTTAVIAVDKSTQKIIAVPVKVGL